MTFVKAPRFVNGKIGSVESVEDGPGGFDGAFEAGGVDDIRFVSFREQ